MSHYLKARYFVKIPALLDSLPENSINLFISQKCSLKRRIGFFNYYTFMAYAILINITRSGKTTTQTKKPLPKLPQRQSMSLDFNRKTRNLTLVLHRDWYRITVEQKYL